MIFFNNKYAGGSSVIKDMNRLIKKGSKSFLIHGGYGRGKTTLAHRISLMYDRYRVIYLKGELTDKTIVDVLAGELQVNPSDVVTNRNFDSVHKLVYLRELFLKLTDVIIIFDNFEQNLAIKDENVHIKVPPVATFMTNLRQSLGDGSFMIFLSSHSFEESFIDASFIPDLLNAKDFDELMGQEEFPVKLEKSIKKTFYDICGGYPGMLHIIACLLKLTNIAPDELVEMLKEEEDNREKVLIKRIWEVLDEDLQHFLSYLAFQRKTIETEPFLAIAGFEKDAGLTLVGRLSEVGLLFSTGKKIHMPDHSAHLVREYIIDDEMCKRIHKDLGNYHNDLPDRTIDAMIEGRHHFLNAGIFDKAVQATYELEVHLVTTGYLNESESLLEELLLYNITEKDRLVINTEIGNIFFRSGDYAQALEYYRTTLDGAVGENNTKMMADSYFHIGLSYQELKNSEDALENYFAAINLYQENSDFAKVGSCYHQIAMLYHHAGDFDNALTFYNMSVEQKIKADDVQGIASNYNNIGALYFMRNEYHEALNYYLKALEHFEQISDRIDTVYCTLNVGIIYQNLSQFNEAIKYYMSAIQISSKLGNIYELAKCYHQLGSVYYDLGDYKEALSYQKMALETFTLSGDYASQASCCHHIGMSYYSLKEFNNALTFYYKSIELASNLNDILSIEDTYHQIGLIHHDLGEYEKARQFYDSSLEIAKKSGDLMGMAREYHQVGVLLHDTNEYEKALEFYRKALSIKEQTHDNLGLTKTHNRLGTAYRDLGNYKDALIHFLLSYKIASEIRRSEFIKRCIMDILSIKDHLSHDEYSTILVDNHIPPGYLEEMEEQFTDSHEPGTDEK